MPAGLKSDICSHHCSAAPTHAAPTHAAPTHAAPTHAAPTHAAGRRFILFAIPNPALSFELECFE